MRARVRIALLKQRGPNKPASARAENKGQKIKTAIRTSQGSRTKAIREGEREEKKCYLLQRDNNTLGSSLLSCESKNKNSISPCPFDRLSWEFEGKLVRGLETIGRTQRSTQKINGTQGRHTLQCTRQTFITFRQGGLD